MELHLHSACSTLYYKPHSPTHSFIQRLILWLSNFYKNHYFARICGLKEQGVKLNHNQPFVIMFMSNMPKFLIMISVWSKRLQITLFQHFSPLILDKCDDAFCLWGGSQSEENWARTEHQTALKIIIIIQLWMWIQVLPCLPGLCPEAVCLCEGEEGGLVCPSGLCWALDPGAAVGGGPGSPHLSEEDGLRADLGGGGHLRSAGLVWVGLWKSHRHKCKYRTDL